MGVDLEGIKPKSSDGENFSMKYNDWAHLWNYCMKHHKDITKKVTDCGSSDGDGLNSADAKELGKRLREDIDNGQVKKYITRIKAKIRRLPDTVKCAICEGTGIRSDWPECFTPEMIGTFNGCNCCNGRGVVDNPHKFANLELDDMRDFSTFLVNCGGFEIW